MSRNQRRMDYSRNMPQQQRSTVNPWETGYPGVGGLLPNPTSLLGQLATPEAQLAVASNLLTNLLRPAVQSSFHSQQMSPMMGMRDSGLHSMQHSMSPPRYRDSYGYSDYGSSRRSFDSYRSRSPPRNAPKRQQQQPSKGRQSQQQQNKNKSSASPGQQHRDNKSRDGDSKGDSKSREKRGSSYERLPRAALTCHVCDKNMWDATSMDNHVRGVAHQKMLMEREKAYEIKSNLIRHEGKLLEQQNQLELERLVHLGKKSMPTRREFCKMCDYAFYGDMASHRKTKSHQNLKSFLHPKCTTCRKEFPVRVDLDKHIVSADHLKVVFKDKLKPASEKKEQTSNGAEGEAAAAAAAVAATAEGVETESMDMGEMPEEGVLAGEDDVEMMGEESHVKTEGADEGVNQEEMEESKEKDAENKEESGEGETKDDALVSPKKDVYDPDIAVGQEYLVPVTGMFCKACRRFFLHEDQALLSHCRTPGHYNNVAVLKSQLAAIQMQQKLESMKGAEEKEATPREDLESSQVNTAKEQTSAGKRPQAEEIECETEAKRPKSEEPYDPSEVTASTPEVPAAGEHSAEHSAENDDILQDLENILQDAPESEDLEDVCELAAPADRGSPRSGRARRARRGRY